MKTPAEFEPIGYWNGWTKTNAIVGMPEVWIIDGYRVVARVASKTSLTDAEAVEALNRLVEKGLEPIIQRDSGQWYICVNCNDSRDGWGLASTISAAVEEALLKLIAAEGGLK